MEKQKSHFIKVFTHSLFSGGLCLIICLGLGIPRGYSQQNLGKLKDDGLQHEINYLDTMYQDAVIPANVSHDYISFSALGGDGGHKRRESNPVKSRKNVKGGKGALVQAWFKIGNGPNEIPPGATIRFIVGQKGSKKSSASNGGGGGGGGTGIAYKDPASGKWELLLVAGGGGGGKGDCCSWGAKGGPGKPFSSGGKGYRNYGDYSSDERKHLGGSAYGGFQYKSEKYKGLQREGWLEGLQTTADGRVGEPTGSKSYHGSKLTHGGWGFGAGGPGSDSKPRSGGGGGYTGGLDRDVVGDPVAKGGESFVHRGMEVTGIVSHDRGHTDNAKNGLVVYQFVEKGSEIRMANSKKCVSLASENTAGNPDIRLADCNKKTMQQWVFVNNAITSALDPGKCLTMAKNGNSSLYDCNDSNSQKWIYDALSKQVRNWGNWNKCLEQKDGNIRTWDCLNLPNQQWEIPTAVGTAPIAIWGNIRIKNIYLAKDENKCLASENTDGNPENETNIRLSQCDDNEKAQQWLMDGTFIRYYAQQNMCADIKDRNTRNGTNIQLWECNDPGAQQWFFDGMTGAIRYRKDLRKCLVAKGTNIEVRDCDSSVDQRWGIRDANVSFDPDKIRTIRRSVDRSKCLVVEGGRTTNATDIQLGSCDAKNTNQRWIYDGVYFRFEKDPTMCLDLRYGKTSNKTNIQLFTCHGGKNQRWVYDHNTKAIWYAHNWKKCVDLSYNKNEDGNTIWIDDCKENNAQKWVIE